MTKKIQIFSSFNAAVKHLQHPGENHCIDVCYPAFTSRSAACGNTVTSRQSDAFSRTSNVANVLGQLPYNVRMQKRVSRINGEGREEFCGKILTIKVRR
jgi:hypothetical protein